MTEKKSVDWELIEKLYRAGQGTVRQLAAEHGVSHTAIQKKAKAQGWTRDLSEKVQSKAKELVAKQELPPEVAKEKAATEQQVVNVLAQKVADIDLTNRADLQVGLAIIRGLTSELGMLSNPEFAEDLERLGEMLDETYVTESGRTVQDKRNQLYRYIISLEGRIKMVKDLAASINVYIPLQRKVVGLDVEKAASEVDDLLLRIAKEKGIA